MCKSPHWILFPRPKNTWRCAIFCYRKLSNWMVHYNSKYVCRIKIVGGIPRCWTNPFTSSPAAASPCPSCTRCSAFATWARNSSWWKTPLIPRKLYRIGPSPPKKKRRERTRVQGIVSNIVVWIGCNIVSYRLVFQPIQQIVEHRVWIPQNPIEGCKRHDFNIFHH